MKNLFYILIAFLAGWVIYANFFQPEKEQNVVTDYTDNLKKSVDKAQDAKVTANLVIIKSAVRNFKNSKGRNPKDLHELIKAGYLGSTNLSYYDYNPDSGEVTIK